MSERETRVLETPNGHKVELKSYLTGRELRQIQALYVDESKIEEGQEKLSNLSGALALKAEDKLIEMAVISLDGKDGDLIDRILDLKGEDYTPIKLALTELLVGGKKDSEEGGNAIPTK
jgi:hypothetical protein